MKEEPTVPKSSPPAFMGFVRKSPKVAPNGRVRTNAIQNNMTLLIRVRYTARITNPISPPIRTAPPRNPDRSHLPGNPPWLCLKCSTSIWQTNKKALLWLFVYCSRTSSFRCNATWLELPTNKKSTQMNLACNQDRACGP